MIVRRPPPDIVAQQATPGNEEVIIKTISYGSKSGAPNRANLIIQIGNAEGPIELREQQEFDEVNKKYTQFWRVRRKQPTEAFTFKAYALDQYGSSGGKSATLDFR